MASSSEPPHFVSGWAEGAARIDLCGDAYRAWFARRLVIVLPKILSSAFERGLPSECLIDFVLLWVFLFG